MSKFLSLLFLGIALSGCAGNATQTVASNDGVTESAEAEKPQKRCRRVKSTTSRIGERVCTSN